MFGDWEGFKMPGPLVNLAQKANNNNTPVSTYLPSRETVQAASRFTLDILMTCEWARRASNGEYG
jgi:hypothetical protein